MDDDDGTTTETDDRIRKWMALGEASSPMDAVKEEGAATAGIDTLSRPKSTEGSARTKSAKIFPAPEGLEKVQLGEARYGFRFFCSSFDPSTTQPLALVVKWGGEVCLPLCILKVEVEIAYLLVCLPLLVDPCFAVPVEGSWREYEKRHHHHELVHSQECQGLCTAVVADGRHTQSNTRIWMFRSTPRPSVVSSTRPTFLPARSLTRIAVRAHPHRRALRPAKPHSSTISFSVGIFSTTRTRPRASWTVHSPSRALFNRGIWLKI